MNQGSGIKLYLVIVFCTNALRQEGEAVSLNILNEDVKKNILILRNFEP